MKKVALVAVVLAAATIAPACGGATGATAHLRDVVLTIHHSRFLPSAVTVEEGTLVRFVVRNADPIDHELIVGPQAVQDAHERGSHAVHGAVPGEVSVPAGEERSTTYRFGRSGRVLFGCHLPGHFDYGMRGVLTVA